MASYTDANCCANKALNSPGARTDLARGMEHSFQALNIVVHNWSFCINIKYIQICSFGYLANLSNVDLNNIILVGATVTMSSEYGSGQYSGSKVVDGIYVPSPETSSIAHTLKETSPWIMIDLGQTRCVKGVKIWNRSAAGCECVFIVRLINLVPYTWYYG